MQVNNNVYHGDLLLSAYPGSICLEPSSEREKQKYGKWKNFKVVNGLVPLFVLNLCNGKV